MIEDVELWLSLTSKSLWDLKRLLQKIFVQMAQFGQIKIRMWEFKGIVASFIICKTKKKTFW
jgi:hypothetical protein